MNDSPRGPPAASTALWGTDPVAMSRPDPRPPGRRPHRPVTGWGKSQWTPLNPWPPQQSTCPPFRVFHPLPCVVFFDALTHPPIPLPTWIISIPGLCISCMFIASHGMRTGRPASLPPPRGHSSGRWSFPPLCITGHTVADGARSLPFVWKPPRREADRGGGCYLGRGSDKSRFRPRGPFPLPSPSPPGACRHCMQTHHALIRRLAETQGPLWQLPPLNIPSAARNFGSLNSER